ncbi:hypothetical protein HK099_000004 [Clydaea vesicula]|uniref:CBS domain-containing protein n=1 Tax=Clydaea vesicula TaxID=447962 RepID=A0AAD5XZK6_9FUNG|nr:hypothetical protein HK099_000004 [Clydaea vesicula]
MKNHTRSSKKVPFELDPVEYYTILFGIIPLLVIIGGVVAGLTIGLMSLDETNLNILKRSGTKTEKIYAERITPIRKNSHLLLGIKKNKVNIFANEISDSAANKYSCAFFAWPVRILITLLWIVAYPIAKLLDFILGESHGLIYRKSELKELVELHGERYAGMLTNDEVDIMRELREKTVLNIMTPIDHVFMLPLHTKLDRKTISALLTVGHSRVPVYNEDKQNVIGVLLVKQLLLLDPDDGTPLVEVKIRSLPRIRPDTPPFEILRKFQNGGSHMALVVDEAKLSSGDDADTCEYKPYWFAKSPLFPSAGMEAKPYKVLGILTLEDVMEEILGSEIIDETDVYIDVVQRNRVESAVKQLKGMSPHLSPSITSDTSQHTKFNEGSEIDPSETSWLLSKIKPNALQQQQILRQSKQSGQANFNEKAPPDVAINLYDTPTKKDINLLTSPKLRASRKGELLKAGDMASKLETQQFKKLIKSPLFLGSESNNEDSDTMKPLDLNA